MSGECILVIDDSREIVRHLTERVLPTFGYQTLCAYDGQSGLKMIREKSPDLIMLDYNLPEMTGIDVLREMAQESLNTPVVLMTGYGSELSAIEAFRLGAKDYLIKPFTVDEIVETIDRALVETRLLHDKEELAEQLRRTKVELSRQSQEMDTLFSIGKAITSLLSVDQVLERVLEAAMYLTNAEDSTIWLLDQEGDSLRSYERKDRDSTRETQVYPIEGSQVGQVMRTGRPLRQSFFTGRGIKVNSGVLAQAVLYVPLKLRGVTMGVLEVTNHESRRSFSRRDEFLLAFLADYAAIAMENARVFQAADQALAAGLEELHALIEITRALTATLNLDEVIRLAINQVHDSWHIEASSLWLLDEAKGNLRVLANVGTPYDVLSRFEVPLGQGFVGHVAQTGKWLYTNNATEHELHYREIDLATGFHTRSLLTVPLVARGKVIGALQLLNKLGSDFDDRDVERAVSIGTAVAIAITNALLFDEAETRKQHLETTLEHAENPILILDEENNILLLNQQARGRLNLTKQAIGQSVIKVLPILNLTEVLAQPLERAHQEEIVLPDNSSWQLRISPIPGHGRILTLQNNLKIKELNQLKDHFIATISHDIRTPLNTIVGFASSLGDIGELNEHQQRFVESIMKSTKIMMSIVNGLLELAKVDALTQTYQPCNVHAIVQNVIHEYHDQSEAKDIDLILTANSRPRQITGDPAQLRSAISNLIDNAIKYSPLGAQVAVTIKEESGAILVQVEDKGQGIPPHDLPHIFEKFYRGSNVNDETKGIGLGLALVQSIAKAHGGDVWVESQEGKGSKFTLNLPFLQTLMLQQER
ncbi:MAG: GAF domain-containing protein [Anaerolineales bacterium]|nr:GAF domain-containing protein [Anaerolineales bacterium]